VNLIGEIRACILM